MQSITQGENSKENRINMWKRLTILANYKLSPARREVITFLVGPNITK